MVFSFWQNTTLSKKSWNEIPPTNLTVWKNVYYTHFHEEGKNEECTVNHLHKKVIVQFIELNFMCSSLIAEKLYYTQNTKIILRLFEKNILIIILFLPKIQLKTKRQHYYLTLQYLKHNMSPLYLFINIFVNPKCILKQNHPSLNFCHFI